MHFTLWNIRAASPCIESWRIFARTLRGSKKNWDMDAEVSAAEILEICGINDLEWCFAHVVQEDHQAEQTEWFVREVLLDITAPRTGFPKWRKEVLAVLALRADPSNHDLRSKAHRLLRQNVDAHQPWRFKSDRRSRERAIYRTFLNTISWSPKSWITHVVMKFPEIHATSIPLFCAMIQDHEREHGSGLPSFD